MKRSVWRNKKGQIQGVDFTLAMIVFMIMFAEVIVLSLHFIEPKYQNIESRAFETRANQISEVFFSSTGFPLAWEYSYTTEFNAFGLRKVDSYSLDANKIARIYPDSLYGITYNDLKYNLSRNGEYGFQFKIQSLFDVTATMILTEPTGSITIETSLGNCDVWAFVVDPFSAVMFTQRNKTDATGSLVLPFTTGIGVLPDGYYTLVVFAKSQTGVFAVDYFQAVKGPFIDLKLKLLVQEDQINNGLAAIHAQHNGATSLGTITLFPYLAGEEFLGHETSINNSPGLTETFNLRIPTNGTCVVLLTGISPEGAAREVCTFPALLNDDFGTSFGRQLLPENKEIMKIESLVTIRECIFKAVLYIWSER